MGGMGDVGGMGGPVTPVEVVKVLLGMGERYDVLVTAQDGAFPMVAVPRSRSCVSGRAPDLRCVAAGAHSRLGSSCSHAWDSSCSR